MKITHILPLSLRLFLSKVIRRHSFKQRLSKLAVNRNEESILYLLNVPTHGNMGDQLIAYTEERLFEIHFTNHRIEIFTTGELECGIKLLKKIILPQDVIFITGGGFLGSIYPDEEKRFQDIMRYFPCNKIVLFPQTFHYNEGSKLLSSAIKLQKSCKRLIISTRELSSYNFIKTFFDNAEVVLLPDVTTCLDFSNMGKNRNGICICSRNDKEKNNIANEIINEFEYQAISNNIKVTKIDTQLQCNVRNYQRKDKIKELVNIFASCQLVITDRLHGMLYSLITGTPVIAIDNNTKKISGTYNEWLKNFSYVKLCKRKDDVNHLFDMQIKICGQKFDNSLFNQKFKLFLDDVKS